MNRNEISNWLTLAKTFLLNAPIPDLQQLLPSDPQLRDMYDEFKRIFNGVNEQLQILESRLRN